MNCMTCKYAEWRKTVIGSLHPSGEGKCKWEMPKIILPISRYYMGKGSVPKPHGGYINRNKLEECPAWEEKP